MTADRGVYQAVAVTDGRITAAERSRDDLDSFIGPGTTVIDDPELVLYPAFADTHNHQLLAARDLDYVSLEQARSIDELVQALREAAARTPAGEWIISSRCWHETHLREGRLPTARELDAASGEHPIFVQRGGHVGVANSAALRLAGITATVGGPALGHGRAAGRRDPGRRAHRGRGARPGSPAASAGDAGSAGRPARAAVPALQPARNRRRPRPRARAGRGGGLPGRGGPRRADHAHQADVLGHAAGDGGRHPRLRRLAACARHGPE